MGMVRVTQQVLVQRTLKNLNANVMRIFKLQDRLATGHIASTPSDDPIAVRRAVNTQANIDRNEQYIRNAQNAEPQLTATASAVQSALDIVIRATELGVQASNGTYGNAQLSEIADEINQLLESMVVEGNREVNGRAIFGGTRTTESPFAAIRDANGEITAVNYVGNGEHIAIAIGDAPTTIVNETGSDAFLAQQNVFQTLIDMRDNLRAGDQNSIRYGALAELDTAMEQLLLSTTRVGAIQNRLERAANNTEDVNASLEELLSNTIDADLADTVLQLNAENNAYQAALNAGARVIQPSLLDFLG
ncbi:MAG: flagellar hook-associated protein 3 FlgL [Candidatus Hydrogenedentes bacterium]|nr:flagellar hook-associated protein 3 FlgL [Candidatus Hydrogenedentota bacterium]